MCESQVSNTALNLLSLKLHVKESAVNPCSEYLSKQKVANFSSAASCLYFMLFTQPDSSLRTTAHPILLYSFEFAALSIQSFPPYVQWPLL